MVIGVPKEIKSSEYRVGLTPSSVSEIIKQSNTVYIEKDAGTGSGFSDENYRASKGWREACSVNIRLSKGINILNGKIVYQPIAQAFDLSYEVLEDLLT